MAKWTEVMNTKFHILQYNKDCDIHKMNKLN